jgi:ATP-dependent Clp protease ATP-binding subunit ClpC
MPKINVYLPDELAAAVRAAGFPVSPVCQQALAEAVRTVTAARTAIEAIRDPRFDPSTVPGIEDRMTSRMTPRLRRAVDLARDLAGGSGQVGTGHLLLGIVDEGDNLGLRVLQALDVDVDEVRAGLEREYAEQDGAGSAGGAAEAGGGSFWHGLSLPARQAIASALEAAVGFGHNYVGCEHLLLGLVTDPDDVAGRVLVSLGVERAAVRRAVTASLAGFLHARQTLARPDADKVDAILRRLDALETRLASLGG